VLKLTFFLAYMSEKRFVDRDTLVQDYVESLESKNAEEKTKRDACEIVGRIFEIRKERRARSAH